VQVPQAPGCAHGNVDALLPGQGAEPRLCQPRRHRETVIEAQSQIGTESQRMKSSQIDMAATAVTVAQSHMHHPRKGFFLVG